MSTTTKKRTNHEQISFKYSRQRGYHTLVTTETSQKFKNKSKNSYQRCPVGTQTYRITRRLLTGLRHEFVGLGYPVMHQAPLTRFKSVEGSDRTELESRPRTT